jgi:hypothetical protein
MARVSFFDVERILKPTLFNYNATTHTFLRSLVDKYEGAHFRNPLAETEFSSVRKNIILAGQSYAVKIAIRAPSDSKLAALLLCLEFPYLVMIGSDLDLIIRSENPAEITLAHLEKFYHNKKVQKDDDGHDRESVTSSVEKFVHRYRIPAEKYLIGEKWQEINMAIGCFIVRGSVKHVPMYLTNNSRSFHINTKKQHVRRFSYNRMGKGFELIVDNANAQSDTQSELTVRDNGGRVIVLDNENFRAIVDPQLGFLKGGNTDIEAQTSYMRALYEMRKEFYIDNLSNKICITPAEILVRLFNIEMDDLCAVWYEASIRFALDPRSKSLAKELRECRRQALDQAQKCVKKINSGQRLLHVISLKTPFLNESVSDTKKAKLTGSSSLSHGERRIGTNNEMHCEQDSTIYRDVTHSAPQLISFRQTLVEKVLSRNVKQLSAVAPNKSHCAILASEFTVESKNIGKVASFCWDVYISPPVSKDSNARLALALACDSPQSACKAPCHMIVLNNVPKYVSEKCHARVLNMLPDLKQEFPFIECYHRVLGECNVIIVHLTPHIPMKLLDPRNFPGLGINKDPMLVSALDLAYWLRNYYFSHVRFATEFDYEEYISVALGIGFFTSPWTLFNPYSEHLPVQKLVLSINAMRNGVFAQDFRFAHETLAPTSLSLPRCKQVAGLLEPMNDFSRYFQIYAPLPTVLINWHKGQNQEDCLVFNARSSICLDQIRRNYIRVSVTLKSPIFENGAFTDSIIFSAFSGSNRIEPCRLGSLRSTLFCEDVLAVHSPNDKCTINYVGGVYNIDYLKRGEWRVCGHEFSDLMGDSFFLIIAIETDHEWATGDKTSNRHGQKATVVVVDESEMPRCVPVDSDCSCRSSEVNWDVCQHVVIPDVIYHPVSILKRETMSQLHEIVDGGGAQMRVHYKGKGDGFNDCAIGTALCGPCFIYPINNLPEDHMYIATDADVVRDQVSGQPTKGSSRGGGSKLSSMEIKNCIAVQGLSAFAVNKLHKDSDEVLADGTLTSKGQAICTEDMKYFQCNIETFKRSALRLKEAEDS